MSEPSSHAKPVIHLRDYRPPAWRVTEVTLDIDLSADATLVRSRLRVEASGVATATALQLDGEALELLELRIDGERADPSRYRVGANRLDIHGLSGSASIETVSRIHPARNTLLQGLYVSGGVDDGFLLTQCEAEGFRHITWFVDRPDVLARYDVTLRADRERYPLLLANGNEVGRGELADGRHWARFVDPFPKPSYLFALVAGRLESIEDRHVTADGRNVRLVIHAQPDAIGQCGYAMDALKQSMRWDETAFGRNYDLDVYHIVATHDFAMGAMENKGLNIFNTKYLLASPDTATDEDFRHVLAVVGHEYFHNWSGNRVTCRDWFQLSLKEGLTVYREQEFESDVGSRTLRRIADVRLLWRAQFSEDAGPLSHPVRPDRYSEINNFYTANVYDKGAEVVRMIARMLGRDGFRRGLDLYFERHDGEAATVEQFLAALGDANDVDLTPWLAWYAQAGTPELRVASHYDASTKTLDVHLAQHTPATPDQPDKQPLPMPIALALFDHAGEALPLQLAGDDIASRDERVLLFDSAEATWRFVGVESEPVLLLLRGYSAPVRLQQDLSADALAVLIRHDSDGFNRWFAADTLARRLFNDQLQGRDATPALQAWIAALRGALQADDGDPALTAELLTIPDEAALTDGLAAIDPDAVHAARDSLESAVATALEADLLRAWNRLADSHGLGAVAQARRRLRGRCLALLSRCGERHLGLARDLLARADNLTDRLAALAALLTAGASDADAALAAFAQRHASDALVLDKWFALQAGLAAGDALARVQGLAEHPAFRWKNPNKVYSLIRTFAAANPRHFHRLDGAGYRFVADAIARVDALTPQVAARLATAFGAWRRYGEPRAALMQAQLQRLSALPNLSADLGDIVRRSMA